MTGANSWSLVHTCILYRSQVERVEILLTDLERQNLLSCDNGHCFSTVLSHHEWGKLLKDRGETLEQNILFRMVGDLRNS